MISTETEREVRWLLRAEGLFALLLVIAIYRVLEMPWWLFAAGFLAPDLSLLGYLSGKRVGAICYNAAHSYLLPLMLGIIAVLIPFIQLGCVCLIWIAHIGFDRALGYGLKVGTSFHQTHLGRIGRTSGD